MFTRMSPCLAVGCRVSPCLAVRSGRVPTDHKAGAAQRALGHECRAVVPPRHAADDGQPQARAAGAARTAFIQADEGLENSFAIGGRHTRLLPVSMLLGAALVSVADTLGRTVIAPAQIPAGLVTALVGTPYFVWLLWRTRRRGAAQ